MESTLSKNSENKHSLISKIENIINLIIFLLAIGSILNGSINIIGIGFLTLLLILSFTSNWINKQKLPL